jgi:16S rRNA (cytosine967-C5)-methyltransferase
MQLAAAGHRVTSVDASASRLARLSENLQRTHLEAQLVEADALDWSPAKAFDAILLDAPCSATGTFRRHPEVLYRARPRIITEGAELQRKLLDRAAEWVKPGGVLVYSVCSLEPEEGEQVVELFLSKHSAFKIASPLVGEVGGGRPASAGQETLLSASSAEADSAPPPNPPHKGEGLPSFLPVSPEGWVRILPGLLEAEGGLDGFFMVRLVRTR